MARTRKLPAKKSTKKPKLPKVGIFGKVATPIGRFLKPFRFLLRPFKTKPMRFIGKVLRKILLIDYFISSWYELRQVTWPTRKETIKLTFAVFIFAIAFGLFIAIADYGISRIMREVIL